MRKYLLAALGVAIAVPVVLVGVAAGAFRYVNRDNASLVVAGHRRGYLLRLPAHYDPAHAVPLVIALHGAAMWPALMESMTGWDRLADREGFIVVYPAGTGALPVWVRGRTNVDFIAALIDTLRSTYAIDPRRIYVAGFSNGGGLAFALSCALPQRIAAVAAVSGAQLLPWNECADRTPVPLIAFHGTADPLAPYTGGKSWITPRPLPDITRWTAAWAERNRCRPTPIDSALTAAVVLRRYADCAPGAPVLLYTIRGGGHQWPGGRPLAERWLGPVTHDIDATALAWAFFEAHPLHWSSHVP